MKRFFKIIRNIFAVFGLIAIIFLADAWSLFSPNFLFEKEKEEFRLSSPHKEYDAVVTIEEPGAVDSSRVRLYIVPSGTPFEKRKKEYKFEVFQANSIMIDKFQWLDDRNLVVIRPPQGRIFNFDPTYYDPRDIVKNQPVQENWRRVTVFLQTAKNN